MSISTLSSFTAIVMTPVNIVFWGGGYHPDNPQWLTENDPVRGNQSFAYSWNKRLIDEILADYRERQPRLEQGIFRICTILGASVHNQITDLFEKPHLIAIRGSASPFVFIYDQDVVDAIVQGVDSPMTGIFNVAGDGKFDIDEIAARLGKGLVEFPAGLLQAALWLQKKLGLTQYGPEQIDFLRYRLVFDNRRLKEVLGYVSRLTSAEVLDLWRSSRETQGT